MDGNNVDDFPRRLSMDQFEKGNGSLDAFLRGVYSVVPREIKCCCRRASWNWCCLARRTLT